MTTTSANIAGPVRPLGAPMKRPVPGEVIEIDEITPTGARKVRFEGVVYSLITKGGRVVLEAMTGRRA